MNFEEHSSEKLSANQRSNKIYFALILIFFSASQVLAQNKPKLTLDEGFNSVSYPSVTLSPDGKSVVIGTERADWEQQIFRNDLWLYHDDGKSGTLLQLTQSGHDTEPKWSPDGRWIAFLSERKTSTEKDSGSGDDKDEKGDISQIYLISPNGGEAVAMTRGQEEVHAFSWSADSTSIYYSTRTPWSKTQKDDYKKEWKDVIQYRTAERGDTIFALDVAATLAEHQAAPAKTETEAEKESDSTPGARAIATSPLRVDDMITSPDGSKLAFPTNAINQRQEKFEDSEIYVLELTGVSKNSGKEKDLVAAAASAASDDKKNPPQQEPRRLTHNQAQETKLHWAGDSRHVFFTVEVGDVAGPYRDLQPHLYWVDSETGTVEQWGKDFGGPVESYGTYGNGALVTARLGTEVQIYAASKPPATLERFNGLPGTYENLSTGLRTARVAYVYSSLTQPAEVYLAEGPNLLRKEDHARSITAFNEFLAEKALPQGKPYRWKADDGTMIEGMLIYPPGKFEQKNLPMFTFIHGGPADADGNHFSVDWYQWSALAATNGWLVFEPNYRGSTGYGDKFLMQIVPQIVSRPGKDILEGVDALVKDGIADPDHLAVGGYSYGGYMTNWLITQTTRFKAAVTGAGAVEHVGNWGNDDTTYDDAYFLGGRPWEAQQRYHDEAAIFQIDKVRTPTHMVAGADDIRVAVLEDYLLEHALYSLGIPNALLIFPGEGHGLGKNPWHGKIKVREELKWLQKYGGVPPGN
jgi:dipeptidyl aminopeptidase/acylaminoacyl peptidase